MQVESQATEILESKLGLKMELENLQKQFDDEKVKDPQVIVEDNSEELEKVCAIHILLLFTHLFYVVTLALKAIFNVLKSKCNCQGKKMIFYGWML